MDLASSFLEPTVKERLRDDPLDESWWTLPSDRFAHLSSSSVGMFLRCPLQFWHRYVHGIKRPPMWSMVLGSANHDAHQWSFQQKLEGKEVAVGEVVEYFDDQVWPNRLEVEGDIDWGRPGDRNYATPDKARATGQRMVAAYAETVTPRLMPVSAAEERFDLWVPGIPVPVIGYLDCKLEGPVVWDMKTGAQKTSQIKGSWQLQARTYAAATGLGVEFHTVSRAQTPAIVTPAESPGLLMPYDAEQAERTVAQYRGAAEMIVHLWNTLGPEHPWPANFHSDACGWCGFRSLCPMWKGMA